MRQRLDDEPTPLPATRWAYTSPECRAIRLLPEGTPFQQSCIYELTYTAKDPVVAAVGLAATRDFVSFLRYATADEGNPLAGDVQYAYSYSISQPSRALNDFQTLGFNEDVDGRRVFDGILSHTGGGSGDQINYRFGQTGRTERNRQNHLYPEAVFPFAHQVLTDHLSGKTGGRQERGLASDTCPKRFEVNTANEYWCKAASLLHTDTQGNDLPDPANVRFYLLSGLSHSVGDVTDQEKMPAADQRRQPLCRPSGAPGRSGSVGQSGRRAARESGAATQPQCRLGSRPSRLSDRRRVASRIGLADHPRRHL